MVLERGSNGGMYIGTDLGVFYINIELLASGTGWQLLGVNLPHTSCAGLEISYKANRLRAGMSGRGVWEHDLWCPDETDLVETGTYTADAFLEAQASIASDAISLSGRQVTYRGGSEVHLTSGFHAEAGSRFHALIHPCDMPGNSYQPKSMAAEGIASEEKVAETQYMGPALQLFPNPAQGSLSVLCSGVSKDNVAQLRLVDATGRIVLTTTMQGPAKVLDVSQQNGFFTVVVDAGGTRLAGRIIIQ